MFGSLLGSLLRVARSNKQVVPLPLNPHFGGGEEEISIPEETPFVQGSTQLGKLIREIFPPPFCDTYEEAIVHQKGYRTVMMARWMTPHVYKEVSSFAKMPKAHIDKLREALAPPDFESRSKYPIFSSY
jgi:hypothetical protein